MAEVPFSARPMVAVMIEQPLCGLSHGVAPCTATGAPCYNTFATCGDPDNFQLGPPLALWFCLRDGPVPVDVNGALPFLADWPDASPARINIAGNDKRMTPLGARAETRLEFIETLHSGHRVDPYRASRGAGALPFWGTWLARNPYIRQGARVVVYEGYEGDAVADMRSREYVAESVSRGSSGGVVWSCKDPLIALKAEKAKWPAQSPGALVEGIADTAAALRIAGAELSDYPVPCFVRIGSEVLELSAAVIDGDGYVAATVAARATWGTQAASHAAEDAVQLCGHLDALSPDAALALLFGAAEVRASYQPLAEWAAEAAAYLSGYVLTGLVTKPEAVADLVAEILEQVQAVMWWDEEAALIRLRAVKPLVTQPPILTAETHLAGGVSQTHYPDRRISRMYIYYRPEVATESRTKAENYRRLAGQINAAMEEERAFGSKALREVFARFLRSEAAATEAAARCAARYAMGSSEIGFQVSDKDGGHQPGDVVRVSSPDILDRHGRRDVRLWAITSRQVVHRDRLVKYTAEDATLSGYLLQILPDTAGPWAGDGSDDPRGVWISENSGLMPDGSPGMLIQ